MSAVQGTKKVEKVKATIVMPRDLYDRIKRAMSVSKRNLSAEIEFAMERHVDEVERAHGLNTSSD